MISLLKNSDIDRNWWDNIISESGTTDPFPYSWYLDIMCPGWCAYYDKITDTVMPLPVRRKAFLNYVYTPFFIQKLGICVPQNVQNPPLASFIERLKSDYPLVDLCISNHITEKVSDFRSRSSYSIDLKNEYESIANNFSRKCRRDVKLAKKESHTLLRNIAPASAIDLFRSDVGKKIPEIKTNDYMRLQRLMEYCISTNKGNIIGAAVNSKLIYSLFYIRFSGKITAIMISSSSESRLKRSGYFIINHLLEEFAGSGLIFDFAGGSSLRGVERFLASFGSRKEEYFHIYNNRLKYFAKWAYSFKNKILSR